MPAYLRVCVYVGTSRQSAVGTDAYVTRPVSSLLWGTSADITYSFAAGRWHSSVLPPPAVATAPRCDLWEQSVKSISYILIGWVGIRNYSQVSTDFNLNRYFVSFISVIDSKLYYSLSTFTECKILLSSYFQVRNYGLLTRALASANAIRTFHNNLAKLLPAFVSEVGFMPVMVVILFILSD